MLAACQEAFPLLRDKIDSLWRDCPPSCQDLLQHVLENGSLGRASIASSDADALIERGFIHQTSNKLERPNRLLERYLKEQPNEVGALARLFGTPESYLRYFRPVLERRITQIGRMDSTLRRYLERGAEDLPDHPEVFLRHVRGIVDRAFELIWQAELGGKIIPPRWITDWKFNKERGFEDWQTTFPQGGQRVRLLDLMTGTEKSKPCAKHVTKGTYALINGAFAFGRFGQHQEGAPIDPGTAYAALHLCIELAAALKCELPNTN
jgi:hypothetical protein